jgi:fluoride exporter
MQSLLFVFMGSGLGGVCRYLIGKKFTDTSLSFPYATLGINIIGSLILGAILSNTLMLKNDSLKCLLAIGFCGGFTTFSTFSMEALQLLKEQQFFVAMLYIILSLVLGLLATFIGSYVSS